MGIEAINEHLQPKAMKAREAFFGDYPGGQAATPVSSLLLVNASEVIAHAVEAALEDLMKRFFQASAGADAVEAIARNRVDLVVIDVGTSEAEGLDFCRLLKKSRATQFLPVFVVGSDEVEAEIRAWNAGANEFLVRPLRARALKARVQASLRHKAMIDSLDDAESVLLSLAQSVEDRDPDLGQHCQRLAVTGAAMGLTLGLPGSDIVALQRSGYLHDIGKLAVPDSVLFKTGALTPDEWEMMKAHAERGARICSGMKSLAPVIPIIRHHHERWDGSGYPHRLRGEEIPLLARILQLADIYDALTTKRPYKAALSPELALRMIRDEVQKGWRDPRLVEMFGDLLPTFCSIPTIADQSLFSLHALAISVERFRQQPGHSQKAQTQAALLGKFRLAS